MSKAYRDRKNHNYEDALWDEEVPLTASGQQYKDAKGAAKRLAKQREAELAEERDFNS